MKKLLNDIAHDKIPLSRALTITKLISDKIDNEKFKHWIKHEIEGYGTDGDNFPIIRFVPCTVFFNLGVEKGYPVSLTSESQLYHRFFFYNIIDSVSSIEKQIEETKCKGDGINVKIELSKQHAEAIFKANLISEKKMILYQNQLQGAYQLIRIRLYESVIEQTKQKLLDTLVNLNKQFPDLDNEFKFSEENNKKVENIVNNYIFGNHNSTNTSAGYDVSQAVNSPHLSDQNEKKLKVYGLTDLEIQRFRDILKNNPTDKASLKYKTNTWLAGIFQNWHDKSPREHLLDLVEYIIQIIR